MWSIGIFHKKGRADMSAKRNPHLGSDAIKWADQQIDLNPELASEVEAELEELKLAELVRRLRKNRKMTQDQLAKELGTKQSAISRIEGGKLGNITLKTLQHLAAATGHYAVLRFTPISAGRKAAG